MVINKGSFSKMFVSFFVFPFNIILTELELRGKETENLAKMNFESY